MMPGGNRRLGCLKCLERLHQLLPLLFLPQRRAGTFLRSRITCLDLSQVELQMRLREEQAAHARALA